MAQLEGNLLVGQSGGPTSVISASAAGVTQEAFKHARIKEIYGGMNGIYGMLREDIIDIRKEKPEDIEGLKYTPPRPSGTRRYKLDFREEGGKGGQGHGPAVGGLQGPQHLPRYFYAGGNDSHDTPTRSTSKR